MAGEERSQTVWIGIPSVPARRTGQAFISFYLTIVIVSAIDALLITHNHQPETWQLAVERVFDDGGSIVAWALAATWPIMETMRMVLAGIFERRTFRRGREQGLAEGRKEGQLEGRKEGHKEGLIEGHREGLIEGQLEGRKETHQLWEAWNQRRLQAAARNEPFTEPPPGTAADNG